MQMIAVIIEFSRYWFALLFGATVAVSFAGMPRTRKNRLAIGCYSVALFLVQLTCLRLFGMAVTVKLYPFITHLPVAVFIYVYVKRSWLISITSMFASYLCCQSPRWIGSVAGAVFDNASVNHLSYIAAVFLMYYFLQKYVADSVRHMMDRSVKSCLLFGSIPAFYYLFDFYSTVYTDLLYTGTQAAVQFMPLLTSALYFVFVLLYYTETQKQTDIQRERDMLDTQFRQAQTEFDTLRQMQQNAAAYRHDMRHHLSFLQALASADQLDEINKYLQTVHSDIDAITPVSYCKNETVNLILSSFAAKAKQSDIQLTIEANLPDTLPFSDTELCSLLSNALENAIHACEKISDSNEHQIKMRVYSKNNKLCIDIRNRYLQEPTLRQDLPVTNEQGHGIGTKSMVHIVEKHGGICSFSVKDGWFIFQATT